MQPVARAPEKAAVKSSIAKAERSASPDISSTWQDDSGELAVVVLLGTTSILDTMITRCWTLDGSRANGRKNSAARTRRMVERRSGERVQTVAIVWYATYPVSITTSRTSSTIININISEPPNRLVRAHTTRVKCRVQAGENHGSRHQVLKEARHTILDMAQAGD